MNLVNNGELNSVVSWISFIGGLASIISIIYLYFNNKINIIFKGINHETTCGGSILKADVLNIKLVNKSQNDYYIRTAKIYAKDFGKIFLLNINYDDKPYMLQHQTETVLSITYSYYSIDNFINLVQQNSAIVISDGKKEKFLKMQGVFNKCDIDSAKIITKIMKGSWIENGIVIADYVKYLIISTDEFGDKNYYSINDNGDLSIPFYNIESIPRNDMDNSGEVVEYIQNNLKLPHNLRLKWILQTRLKVISN